MKKSNISKLNTKKYFAIAIVTFMIALSYTFSRYKAEAGGGMNARIASFEITLSSTMNQAIDANIRIIQYY